MAIEVGRNAKDFDCQSCSLKYCDEDGLLPGSRGKSPPPLKPWVIDGMEFDVCPMMQITPFSRHLITLHNKTAKGLLMDMLRQPNAYLQAIEIIER